MTEMELFSRANQQFGRLVVEVPDDQWSRPVPSLPGRTIRDLVAQVAISNRQMEDVLAGRPVAAPPPHPGELMAGDPQVAWTVAATDADTAVARFKDLDRMVHLSYGDYPARVYLRHAVINRVIHAWDLAHALQVDETLEAGLVQAAWEYFQPEAEDWRRLGLIGPAVVAPVDGSIQTKLLALAGRRA